MLPPPQTSGLLHPQTSGNEMLGLQLDAVIVHSLAARKSKAQCRRASS